jgi:hypothetical protein
LTCRLRLLDLAVIALLGCHAQRPLDPVEHAAFGVLFGGQVQELDQIPFELDRARQTLGFRIDFRDRLRQSSDVTWELDVPLAPPESAKAPRASKSKSSLPPDRTLRRGHAKVPSGSSRFEQVLALEPGDPLGTWNVRVQLDSETIIDRPFLLYDALARRRANEAAAARKNAGR